MAEIVSFLHVKSWEPSQLKYKMGHEILNGISGLLHI